MRSGAAIARKRDLKASAKRNIKQVHKKKGHKLKADEDLKRTNKSVTLKAAHDFCTLYMKDLHKATLNLVNEEDMYISVSELKK